MSKGSASAVMVVAGISAVVAFFLPFLDLGGVVSASGLDILMAEHAPWTTRLALLALPLGGLALVVLGAAGGRHARLTGFFFGAGVFGYLGYQLVKLFIATTGVGLWITLAAAAAAFVAALAAKGR